MFKKILISLLIFALFNYLIGCYTGEEISSEQLHIIEEKIVEAVLLDGSVIKFSKNGGEYKLYSYAVVGTTENRKKIIFPVENISELRKTLVEPVPLMKMENQKFVEVISKTNRLYKFDDNGGYYDKERGVISGTLESGSKINLKKDLIHEFHNEEPNLVSEEDLQENEEVIVSRIIMKKNNIVITFNKNGASLVKNIAVVTGFTENGDLVNIDVSELLYVNVSRLDGILTGLLITGIVAGVVVLIAAAAASSWNKGGSKTTTTSSGGNTGGYGYCPIIYSNDSSKYVLDAQPLGGAFTKGLQKTDLSKLNHIKEVSGKYKLLLRNEKPEVQRIDQLSLFVVDHPKNSDVFPDLYGNFYTFKTPQLPAISVDENGKDLNKFIAKRDDIFWQSKLPINDFDIKDKYKHQLKFVFPKPVNKTNAKLIIKAGTSQWGVYMLDEFLKLYGNNIDDWYEKIDNMSKAEIEKEEMMQLAVREELYYLNLQVKEAEGLKSQKLIFGGGPYVTETRTYDLDLTNVIGDSLVIQLNPPYGFWTIDYIAVDYGEYTKTTINEYNLSQAYDKNGREILDVLLAEDNEYYALEFADDYLLAEFDAIQKSEEMEHSFFLKTSGYYDFYLPRDHPMQAEKLYEILNTTGKAVEYSMELFKEQIIVLE
jgi:hypothetical protein